jgi:tetratricopeptide (TPR) repeat protein
MSLKKRFFIIVFLMVTGSLIAGEEQLIIAKANKAYMAGYFDQATELYKKVIKSGVESSELYFNLGNACYKMNQYSSAILYYEKARKMDPGNEDAAYNLAVVNNKIADKIEPLPEIFYNRWFRALREMMSMDNWAWFGIFLLIGALILGFLYFISTRLLLRKVSFWAGLVLLGASFLSMSLAYKSYSIFHNNKEAIIFSPTITVKSSPDEKSTDLFVLHEGTKVRLIDNIGNWYEIRIANGSIGWLQTSSVEII